MTAQRHGAWQNQIRHADMDQLTDLYMQLHSYPELSDDEIETSRVMEEQLALAGYRTFSGIGGTGVVGILDRDKGPTVLLRADMDALPIKEETDLPYKSQVVVEREGQPVPVMHACGHDIHMAAMIGAAQEMSADTSWQGCLVILFQPAEETGSGARTMLEDGLLETIPSPDVVMGQHVMPIPSGFLGVRPGPAFAAGKNLRITIHGTGGHGSQPERAINPITIASMAAVRIQNLQSSIGAFEPAIISIGKISSGSAPNIIPNSAELLLTVRAYREATMASLIEKINTILEGEARVAGGESRVIIDVLHEFPLLANDVEAASEIQAVFSQIEGVRTIDPTALMISEDVGEIASAAGVPLIYWWLGGADPSAFKNDKNASVTDFLDYYPANHSPKFAPTIRPTLDLGVLSLVKAAKHWLSRGVD